MAQATKSSSKRPSRSGSKRNSSTATRASAGSRRGKSSNSRGAQRKRSSASGASSRAKSTGRRGTSAGRSAARNAGGTVTQIASKAKAPLLVGGAALAGIAGGLVMRERNHKPRNPLKKLGGSSVPKGMTKAMSSVSKIDVDSLTTAAKRVGRIGQQVGDVAEAAEKSRKKNK